MKNTVVNDNTNMNKAADNNNDDSKKMREINLRAAKYVTRMLADSDDSVRNDRDIVLASVTYDGEELEYAAPEFKNDRDIVTAAITNYGPAIRFAGEELKNDRELALTAVRRNGKALEYVGDSLRSDREVVMEAVWRHGDALRYAGEELRGDFEIVKAACKYDISPLAYADMALLNNKDNIMALIAGCNYLVRYMAIREPDTAVINPDVISFIPEAFKHDKDVFLELVKKSGLWLSLIPKEFLDDKRIVMAGMYNSSVHCGKCPTLEDVPEVFRSDRDVAALLVSLNQSEYVKLPATLRMDREVIINAFERPPYGFFTEAEPDESDAAVAQQGDVIIENDPEVLAAIYNAFYNDVKNREKSGYFGDRFWNEYGDIIRSTADAKEETVTVRFVKAWLSEDDFEYDDYDDYESDTETTASTPIEKERTEDAESETAGGAESIDNDEAYASLDEIIAENTIASEADDISDLFDEESEETYTEVRRPEKPAAGDRPTILQMINDDISLLTCVPRDMLNDRDFVLEIIDNCDRFTGNNMTFKTENDRNTADCRTIFDYLPNAYRHDREIVRRIVRKQGEMLFFVDEYFRDDFDIVMDALEVSEDERTFIAEYSPKSPYLAASDRLKEDLGVIIKAYRNGYAISRDLPESMKKDKYVALAAVEASPYEYVYFDRSLRMDREIILTAFSKQLRYDYKAASPYEYDDIMIPESNLMVLRAIGEVYQANFGYNDLYYDEFEDRCYTEWNHAPQKISGILIAPAFLTMSL